MKLHMIIFVFITLAHLVVSNEPNKCTKAQVPWYLLMNMYDAYVYVIIVLLLHMHRYRTYSWAEPKHLWTKVQKSGQLYMCHALTLNASFDKKKNHGFRCIENEPHAKDYGIRSRGVNSVHDIHFFIPEIKYSYAGTVTLHQEWKALDLVTIHTRDHVSDW